MNVSTPLTPSFSRFLNEYLCLGGRFGSKFGSDKLRFRMSTTPVSHLLGPSIVDCYFRRTGPNGSSSPVSVLGIVLVVPVVDSEKGPPCVVCLVPSTL